MSDAEIKRELKELKKIISEENRFTTGVMEDIRLLRGWWQIKNVCGLKCDNRTMKRLVKKFHLPVYYEHGRPRVRKYQVRFWMIEIQKHAFRGKERAEIERLEKDFFEKMDHKQKVIEEELRAFQGTLPLPGEGRGDISKPMDPAPVAHGPHDRGHPDLNFWFSSLRHGSSS
jgi:hypothetical protein